MSEFKELIVTEQPQQLITIEPAKYVALVFESFRKKFDAYKEEADKVTIDVTTTAGMKSAVEWRAKFRDEIRIASESARKERKAPILEIGRLLDGAAKEIAEEVAPYESRFDSAIKAEEKRKDDEKIAKALAESARITAIRKRIAEMQAIPAMLVGKSSETIAAAIESLESVEIAVVTHAEFCGEAEMAKIAAVSKLGEMLTAQLAHEAEQKRIAEERAQLERERAEAAERERIAAEARTEEERKAREVREAQEAVARAEREAEQRKLDEQRAELARQQAEFDRQREEVKRAERERLATIAAEEQRKREEVAAAERAEAERVQAERMAAVAEQMRREQAQFEKNGPGDVEIVKLLAREYAVSVGDVMGWMNKFDYAAADEYFAAANVAAN